MYQTFSIETEFREVLKWVTIAIPRDVERLQAVRVMGSTLAATDGWRIHKATIKGAMPIPEGKWKIHAILTDIVVMEQIEVNFPDVEKLIASAENKNLALEFAGKFTVQTALSPALLRSSMNFKKLCPLIEVYVNAGPVIFKGHTESGHQLAAILMPMHNGNWMSNDMVQVVVRS